MNGGINGSNRAYDVQHRRGSESGVLIQELHKALLKAPFDCSLYDVRGQQGVHSLPYAAYQKCFQVSDIIAGGSLDGARIIAEALFRWDHQYYGCISPSELFPRLYHNPSEFLELTRFMIHQACYDCVRWQKAKQPFATCVSVNVPPSFFSDPLCVAIVYHALDVSGLSPNRLILEVTENEELSLNPCVPDRIQLIRNRGVQLYVDDFSELYSTFDRAIDPFFSGVKIDYSFHLAIVDNDIVRCLEIIFNVASIMSEMCKPVIVERLETKDEAESFEESFEELPAVYVQGYRYHKPERVVV